MRLNEYKAAFDRYDEDASGSLDIDEIRNVFKDVGAYPSDAELYHISRCLEANDGHITFEDFVKIVDKTDRAEETTEELETLEAFVALGGAPDKSGFVDADRIKKVIQDFGLTIQIDELLELLDTDNSGEIDYDEFKCLFLADEEEEGLVSSRGGPQQGSQSPLTTSQEPMAELTPTALFGTSPKSSPNSPRASEPDASPRRSSSRASFRAKLVARKKEAQKAEADEEEEAPAEGFTMTITQH